MRKDSLTLLLIILIASVMSVSLFSTGQFWWDDFASYILQARAILTGTMSAFVSENGRAIAQSTYPVGPAAYPWGYPLLLAPIYALTGLSLTTFKLLNSIFFAAFLATLYLYARQRFSLPLSAALTAFMGFNPTLLKALDLIQADFAFLFTTSLAVYLIDRQWRTARQITWQKIGIGILIFWSFFLRTNGILLLGPLLLVDFFQSRAYPRPALHLTSLPYLTFLLLTGLSLLLFPGGQSSYFEHYELFFSPARLIDNLLFYVGLPASLFGELPYPTLLFGLISFLSLWGLAQKARAELPALAFSFLTLVLYISWPERQGLRFIYPILAFYLIFAAHGLLNLAAQTKSTWSGHSPTILFGALGVVALLVSFLQTGGSLFQRREINGPFDPVSAEMFAYIRQETAAESTIIFFKPRLMRLLGERYSILLDDCARLPEGNYLVIHLKQEGNGQLAPDKAKTCNPEAGLQVVFKNQRFVVYQVTGGK